MTPRKSAQRRDDDGIQINLAVVAGVATTVVLVSAAAWWLYAGRSGIATPSALAPVDVRATADLPLSAASASVPGTASAGPDATNALAAEAGAMTPDTTSPGGSPSGGGGQSPDAGAATQEAGAWLTADGFAAFGPPAAPVSFVVFTDYQCPNCKQFAVQVLPWLRQTWIARGLVTVVLRDFAVLGPDSVRAAEAAHCAGEQGRYVSYHDRLFEAQGARAKPFEEQSLLDAAEELGLDAARFAECLEAGRYRARVQESTQYGLGQGFEGTPTYLVNGRKVAGAIDVARWDELFEAYATELAQSTQSTP